MVESGISPAEALDLVVTNVLSDPVTLVLVLFGGAFVGGASAVLGYLSLGAAVEQVAALVPRRGSASGPNEEN